MIRSLTRMGKDESVLYDDAHGNVKEWHQPEAKRQNNGVFFEVAGVGFAVYAEADEVFLQCGEEKFNLGQAILEYHHNWNEGTTTFRARDEQGYCEQTYQAWWAELGLRPDEVRLEPELNLEEDLLNWVFQLSHDEELRESVRMKWLSAPSAPAAS